MQPLRGTKTLELWIVDNVMWVWQTKMWQVFSFGRWSNGPANKRMGFWWWSKEVCLCVLFFLAKVVKDDASQRAPVKIALKDFIDCEVYFRSATVCVSCPVLWRRLNLNYSYTIYSTHSSHFINATSNSEATSGAGGHRDGCVRWRGWRQWWADISKRWSDHAGGRPADVAPSKRERESSPTNADEQTETNKT